MTCSLSIRAWCGAVLLGAVALPAGLDAQAQTAALQPDAPPAVASAPPAPAAQAPAGGASIEDLQRRVAELEKAQTARKDQPESEAAGAEHDHAGLDNAGRLQIHGFGDINLSTTSDGPSQFSLGQFDLFLSAALSDRVHVVSENVFEAGDDNEFSVDVERLLIQFDFGRRLKVEAGRFHSAIGYYNTAYHHGTWFQTAVGRPQLMAFEDNGGILPVHNVGVSAGGRIGPDPLGLSWVAEVGNGRAPLDAPGVLNKTGAGARKSVAAGLTAKPDSLEGAQFGLFVYRDNLRPTLAAAGIPETIVTAHAVFSRNGFDWLNEVAWLHHDLGTAATNVSGAYSQVSQRVGALRPYARYEYLDVPAGDPLRAVAEHMSGPSVGLRLDPMPFAAVKVEYRRQSFGTRPDALNAWVAQLSFAF